MKYAVTWELRPNVTEEAAKRSLTVFGKWSPAHPEHFHAFLGRIDGNGGFAVVETDDATEIAKDTAPFTPWFEFHVYPCLEIADLAALQGEGLAFLESVS
ncbi:MAG TPA: DUF3303 family protein [Nocardioides sp.]|uniref:DUF3303 domain-containing protein n=1 Tax=Nocardioides sp. TaxID=35761 RepID=UPI002F4228A7